MDEITTNINVSGIPVEWIPEINKVSNNFSKAVRTLIKEALEARKAKESNANSASSNNDKQRKYDYEHK